LRILIVDDSVFAQQFTKKEIVKKFPDAEILSASSGEQGCELVKVSSPDFVITDLLMPGIGGKGMVEQIRASGASCKIIVLSSDIQKAVKEEMEQLGILFFINKPLTEERAQTLTSLLGEN
jgi:two-component system, chemotaxis family, chemotaxis protein CheY